MKFQIGRTTSIPISLSFQALEDKVLNNEVTIMYLRMDVTGILLNPETHIFPQVLELCTSLKAEYLSLERENEELRKTIQERKLRKLEQENMELNRAILDEMLKLLHRSQAALWMLDGEMKNNSPETKRRKSESMGQLF